MTLTWDFVTADKVIEEIKPHITKHSAEVYKDEFVERSNPAWDKYKTYGEMKVCWIVTLRDNNILVGYSVFFVYEHLHHPEIKQAISDSLYLDEKYRKGRLGVELIKRGEKYLLDLGVKRILYSAKMPVIEGILKYLGYSEYERVYKKESK